MRPTVTSDEVLTLLHGVDAGRVRVRLVERARSTRTYRADNGWLLRVLCPDGTWEALDGVVTPDGRAHDPWHHLYDEDHRKDAGYFAAVRAFRPEHPERYGIGAAQKRRKRAFEPRARVTKNGRRAFC